jgi:uncharacterized protein (TIGR01777 family)
MGAPVRVGLTGSSGFIGTALVEALRERGDEVVRFVRPDSGIQGEPVIRWDPSRHLVDEQDLSRAGGFDAVVNLAGAGIGDRRWSDDRKREILRSRVDSTSLLVQALRSTSNGTSTLASGSAVGYYGSRGDEELSETSTAGDDFLARACVQWEDAARALSDDGANVATLRSGIVMSADGGALRRQLPLFRLGVGGPLSSGRQWLSPISLVDEVRAILWTVDHRVSGPVNLTCPEPITNLLFTKELAKALHRPAVVRVPEFALRVVLGSQLAREAALASQRVVPQVLSQAGFVFQNHDTHAIVGEVVRLRTN